MTRHAVVQDHTSFILGFESELRTLDQNALVLVELVAICTVVAMLMCSHTRFFAANYEAKRLVNVAHIIEVSHQQSTLKLKASMS